MTPTPPKPKPKFRINWALDVPLIAAGVMAGLALVLSKSPEPDDRFLAFLDIAMAAGWIYIIRLRQVQEGPKK